MANRLTKDIVREAVESGEVDFDSLKENLKEDARKFSDQEKNLLQIGYIMLGANTDMSIDEFVAANLVNKEGDQ